MMGHFFTSNFSVQIGLLGILLFQVVGFVSVWLSIGMFIYSLTTKNWKVWKNWKYIGYISLFALSLLIISMIMNAVTLDTKNI